MLQEKVNLQDKASMSLRIMLKVKIWGLNLIDSVTFESTTFVFLETLEKKIEDENG